MVHFWTFEENALGPGYVYICHGYSRRSRSRSRGGSDFAFWWQLCDAYKVQAEILSIFEPSLMMLDRTNSTFSTGPSWLEHGLIDNSSLSTITMSDGNKRLFFQESGSSVRQAFYNVTTQTWDTSMSYTITPDGRVNTPISAISYIQNYPLAPGYSYAGDTVCIPKLHSLEDKEADLYS